MDRGAASNIEVPTADILPSQNSFRALALRDGRIPGYQSLRVGRKDFCFVPFADKERNHLVSADEFKANMIQNAPLAGPDWANPVPNAISCQGSCTDSANLKHLALSCVLTNPQKVYRLSMPHSFIHIELEENKAKWLFNSPDPRVGGFDVSLVEKNSSYPNRLDLSRKSGGGGSAIDGDLVLNLVPLGKEYTINPTLDKAIFGSDLEQGNTAKLEKALVVRINQMISEPGKSFSAADLHALLKRPETAALLQAGGKQDYYIYSPDGKEVLVTRKEEALLRAPWLQALVNNEPDGQVGRNYAKLESDLILPPGIVSVNPLPGANIVVPPFGRMNVQIEDDWQPGSGSSGCSGKLHVAHTTTVFSWGVAIIPVAPGAGGVVDRIIDAIF